MSRILKVADCQQVRYVSGGEDREKLVLSEDGFAVSLACCHDMDLPYITAL